MIGVQCITRKSKYCRIFFTPKSKDYSTQVQTAKPIEYPKIEDVSPRGKFRLQQEKYFAKIKNLHTIEEKLFALNLPRYWGWPSFILKEGVLPYNPLPFAQFITRTVISENSNLPLFRNDKTMQSLLVEVKKELEKVILFECTTKRWVQIYFLLFSFLWDVISWGFIILMEFEVGIPNRETSKNVDFETCNFSLGYEVIHRNMVTML